MRRRSIVQLRRCSTHAHRCKKDRDLLVALSEQNTEDEEDNEDALRKEVIKHLIFPSSLGLNSGCRRNNDQHIQNLCKEGELDRALDALSCLLSAPASQVYMSLLRACAKKKSLIHAKSIYTHIIRHGPHPAGLLGDCLVGTLSKCGAYDDAFHVSRRLPRRSVFCWTAMISSYADSGLGNEALAMHQFMREDGVEPNQHTFASLFKACGSIPNVKEGKELHSLAQRKGFISDAVVGTALINMYAKFGNVVEAEGVFGKMSERDIVSWTTMLTIYVNDDQGEKALQLYWQMQMEGIVPDDRVFVMALQACGTLAEKEECSIVHGQPMKLMSLDIGQAIHADARKRGYAFNVYVGTTLISMYGKCGAIAEAEDVFQGLSDRNIVSWNAMLTAYIEQQHEEKALYLYRCMLKENVSLDDITLICVLQACAGTGNLTTCRWVHFHAVVSGYDQNHSAISTLIHGYGNCGSMDDAVATFDQFPGHDIVSWSACVAGHAMEGNILPSLAAFDMLQLYGVKPNDFTFSGVLNACSHAGLVLDGLQYFTSIAQNAPPMIPDLKHFSILIDLLGRSGNFKEVEHVLKMMPMNADMTLWLNLLGVCRIHGNIELAKEAFDRAVQLQPEHPAPYVSLSNIYVDAGLKESAAEVKNSMLVLGLEESFSELECA